MKKHYREENDCLNCGTTLQGKFCHVCGQENLHIKESFGHMMNHAISDYFHFDHQFFHTLKPLLFNPGYLTNEYVAGRRTQYLHPVKMYIFISVVYFLLLFQSGQKLMDVNETGNRPVSTEKQLDSVKKMIAANAYIPNSAKKQIAKEIDKQKAAGKKAPVKDTIDERGPNKWFHPLTRDTSYAEYLINQKKLPEANKDNFFLRIWNKKVYRYKEKYGNGAREQFTEELQHNTPKMMFLLLPLLAVMFGVTFWKSKKFYVEHLIYAFHLFCFVFLFLGIMILFKMAIPFHNEAFYGWTAFVEIIYITWYVYRSLRVVYQRSRFRTITKMAGMGLVYFLVATVCISLLFIVTTII